MPRLPAILLLGTLIAETSSAIAAPTPDLPWHLGPGHVAEMTAVITRITLIADKVARQEVAGRGSPVPISGLSGTAYNLSKVPELTLRLSNGVLFRYPILATSYPPMTEPLKFTRGEAMVIEYRPSWPALRIEPAAPD